MKPEEILDKPGYYAIPGFNGYAVKEDGTVFSFLSLEYLDGSMGGAGYLNFRLRNNQGLTSTVGIHRILALAFKHPGRDTRDLFVDHIDGDKTNIALSNLEWVTPLENARRAMLLKLSSKAIEVYTRDVDTGEVKKWRTATECAEAFGVSKDAVLFRLRCEEDRVWPERKQYRSHNDSEWKVPPDIEAAIRAHGRSRAVVVKDLRSNEEIFFERMQDAARHVRLGLPAFFSKVTPKQPIIPGFYLAKFEEDKTPFREIQDYKAEFYSTSLVRPVKAVNADTGEEVFYNNAKMCAEAHGVGVTTLSYWLSKETAVQRTGFRYFYLYNQQSFTSVMT